MATKLFKLVTKICVKFLSNKPAKGHVAKANTAPKRFIREFKNVELGEYEVGKEITVMFSKQETLLM